MVFHRNLQFFYIFFNQFFINKQNKQGRDHDNFGSSQSLNAKESDARIWAAPSLLDESTTHVLVPCTTSYPVMVPFIRMACVIKQSIRTSRLIPSERRAIESTLEHGAFQPACIPQWEPTRTACKLLKDCSQHNLPIMCGQLGGSSCGLQLTHESTAEITTKLSRIRSHLTSMYSGSRPSFSGNRFCITALATTPIDKRRLALKDSIYIKKLWSYNLISQHNTAAMVGTNAHALWPPSGGILMAGTKRKWNYKNTI